MEHQHIYDNIMKIIRRHTNLKPDFMDYQQLKFITENMEIVSLRREELEEVLSFNKLFDK